ncbi:uncharacterized protein [Dysidea avara]|uniref:uncharacterized protein n=1 Tax=Dysidea avara TaxID=196820 RepID=UPI003327DA98
MNTAKQHQAAETNNPVNVLGLWWDTHSDLIYSSPKPIASLTTTTTKRDILKWASTIFDPLGLISPVTISAKFFLQTLWQQHINWDTNLSEELNKTWNQISRDIVQATALPFPRQCASSPTTSEPTLHIFVDGSPRAYGAAVYLQQGTNCTLVMSKSRAAPLKKHSLPRLELMAAVVAARLCSFVKTSLNTITNLVLWSDSQIVLSWIFKLARFPYLLPSHHYFTELVIRNAHKTNFHSGVNATLAIVWQTYWIPSARQRIKTILRKCVICRKTSGKPYAMPEPPPLVKSRVNQTDPFQVTGVDFTGALFVRTPSGELHLEIVTVRQWLYLHSGCGGTEDSVSICGTGRNPRTERY